jgi:hypothetical protein
VSSAPIAVAQAAASPAMSRAAMRYDRLDYIHYMACCTPRQRPGHPPPRGIGGVSTWECRWG